MFGTKLEETVKSLQKEIDRVSALLDGVRRRS